MNDSKLYASDPGAVISLWTQLDDSSSVHEQRQRESVGLARGDLAVCADDMDGEDAGMMDGGPTYVYVTYETMFICPYDSICIF